MWYRRNWYRRNADEDLREAEREARLTRHPDDINRYDRMLRRAGLQLCDCESVTHSHDYPCLNQANLLTAMPSGRVCDDCAGGIPQEYHSYDCWCDACFGANVNKQVLGNILLTLVQRKSIPLHELQHPLRWLENRCHHNECEYLGGFGPLPRWGDTSPCKMLPASGEWLPIPELRYTLVMGYAEWDDDSFHSLTGAVRHLVATDKLLNLEDLVF